jgi:hypothetical protein
MATHLAGKNHFPPFRKFSGGREHFETRATVVLPASTEFFLRPVGDAAAI